MKFLCDNCEKYPCDDTEIKLMKYCPVYSPKPKPQTNADRIRAMSDEELAEVISNLGDCDTCYLYHNGCSINIKDAVLEWLKKEVKND